MIPLTWRAMRISSRVFKTGPFYTYSPISSGCCKCVEETRKCSRIKEQYIDKPAIRETPSNRPLEETRRNWDEGEGNIGITNPISLPCGRREREGNPVSFSHTRWRSRLQTDQETKWTSRAITSDWRWTSQDTSTTLREASLKEMSSPIIFFNDSGSVGSQIWDDYSV